MLQLKIRQQATLTPQLQYAIKLLQLTKADLVQEINNAVEANPLLEILEPNHITSISASSAVLASNTQASRNQIKQVDPYFAHSAEVTLREHLRWQLNLANFSAQEQQIASMIIDAISETGYLNCELSTLQELLQKQNITVTQIEITKILHRVQTFEPIGIAGRDLRECLMLQLNALPTDLAHLSQAKLLVTEHLDLLAKKKYAALSKLLGVDAGQLTAIIKIISKLNPKPGITISSTNAEYITPDLIVIKKNNQWQVQLNAERLPQIITNTNYNSLLQQAHSKADGDYLREKYVQAKSFIYSLHQRNKILLGVASYIVAHQQRFLEYGELAMQPLVLQDIADKLKLHISTISRATSNKYIATPRGTLALKYFFSRTIVQGEDKFSAHVIRAKIQSYLAAEAADTPLTDSEIATQLAVDGIPLARRTVSKYREVMAIPAACKRKKLR